VNECSKAERALVGMSRLRTFQPAVELPAIDVGRFLDGLDRFASYVAQHGLPTLLELPARPFVEFGIGNSRPRVEVDCL
jgi:hypothetical protein